MKLRFFTAALVVLAATSVWGQSMSSSATTPTRRKTAIATASAESAAAAKSESATSLRVREMGSTLTKMRLLLKQMRAKTAASGSKDSMAVANLDLWDLMLSQLDQQYEQLRQAARAREDLDARRNAMYKQAEERAAAAARNARQATNSATTSQSSAPVATSTSPATPAAAQTAPTPSTSAPN